MNQRKKKPWKKTTLHQIVLWWTVWLMPHEPATLDASGGSCSTICLCSWSADWVRWTSVTPKRSWVVQAFVIIIPVSQALDLKRERDVAKYQETKCQSTHWSSCCKAFTQLPPDTQVMFCANALFWTTVLHLHYIFITFIHLTDAFTQSDIKKG